MALTIPTTTQIRDQIISDIEGKIGQTVPALPKAFFRVLATALAGVVSLLYRFAGWAYRQIFPQTADSEALDRIGGQFQVTRKPAVAAILTATATGTNTTQIPAGTLWRSSSGQVYQQDEAVTISGGTATITIEALTPGSAGNLADALTVTIVTPIAGVDQLATITATTTTGEDAESTEAYRARVMARLANKPQGGAAADYINWALEVPGIVKAFAFRTAPGDVTVYPLIDITGPDRVPGNTKLTEVQDYLNDTVRRPLCANVYAAAMTERVFDVVVSGLSPTTTDQKNAIMAAWENYLYDRYPIQYDDEADPKQIISVAALYGEAAGTGVQLLTFALYIDGNASPIQNHELASDEIAKLGDVTWP